MSKTLIVNAQDEVIGAADRDNFPETGIQRVSGLWIENRSGEVLLSQRSYKKKFGPGRWSIAVAGTVEEDETYLSNIIKETEEEIGIKIQAEQLTEEKKLFIEAAHTFFLQMYSAVVDLPLSSFKIQEGEVEEIRWISLNELKKEFEEHPETFTSSFGLTLQALPRVASFMLQ